MTDWQVSLDNPEKNLEVRVATDDELNQVITTGHIPEPKPVQLDNTLSTKPQRANPGMAYYNNTLVNNVPIISDDQLVLDIFNQAIKNGWRGWRDYVNDSITQGEEGLNLVKALKTYKRNVPLREVFLRDDFCDSAFGRAEAKLHQELLVNEVNMLSYITRNMVRPQ
jgi:hypothetical protein